MAAHHQDNPLDEPFGQRGVMQFVRPVVLMLCALGLVFCLLMMGRSDGHYDSLSRTYNGRRIEVASAIDRFLVTVGEPRPGEVDSPAWVPASVAIPADMLDGWLPSWKKLIGVEWGRERDFGRINPFATHWRLRIKWSTLALLYLIPLAWEVVRRRLVRRHADVPLSSAAPAS